MQLVKAASHSLRMCPLPTSTPRNQVTVDTYERHARGRARAPFTRDA